MEYSAFISYRHGELIPTYAKEFCNDLQAELRIKDRNHQVFIDTNRINGFIETTIAPALCKSVCMIIIFTPTYYQYDSHETPWCVQELAAFHDREVIRLEQLREHLPTGECFIIPVLINSSEKDLPKILGDRIWHKHEVVAISAIRKDSNSLKTNEYYSIIGKLAEKIHVLKQTINSCNVPNSEIFSDCDEVVTLPEKTHEKVVITLQQYQDNNPTNDLLM